MAPRELAFTLIEMMAVVLIVGLVSTLVMVNVLDRVEWARAEVTRTKMRALEGSLEMFQLENRIYPGTEPGLTALLGEGGDGQSRHAIVRNAEALEDGWARRLEYESPGQHQPRSYDLWSWGSDGLPGGDGYDAEIVSWSAPTTRD